MQYTSTLALAIFATLATATPVAEKRQVEWHAVGSLYSGGGCTDQSLIFADPIWGAANECHPLDRSGQVPPIVSYKTNSVDAGCTVTLYYDLNCSQPVGGFAAGVNGCVQGSSPFESAIVTCP